MNIEPSRGPAAKLPRISIVTLSFNQADFLPRCLASVRSQLREGDEHFCIDPGSTDGSRAILSKASDGMHIPVFEQDEGPADGLNRAFARARGELFAYLNADDELCPGALEYVRSFFGAHPATDLLLGAIRVIDEDGRPAWRKRLPTVPDRIDLQIGSVRFYQQGFFFRRSIWDRGVRFNVANTTCWDWEFFVEAFLLGATIERRARVLGFFRLHPRSMTGQGRNKKVYLADMRRIAEKVGSRAAAPLPRWRKVWRLLWRKIDPGSRLQELLP